VRSSLALIFAGLLACSSKGHEAKAPTRDAGPAAMTAATIDKQDLPDAAWNGAADVVLAAARDYHRQIGAARVVVRVVRAPGGDSVPYLMSFEESDAAGAVIGRGRTLVHQGAIVAGGGPEAASAYLRSLGFPDKKLDPGLLCEVLDLHAAVPVDWLVLPTVHGWPALASTDNSISHARVELEHGAGRATLRLYRPGPIPSGGGDAPTPIERMTIEFDAEATITARAEREDGSGGWKPIT
jgi:hypothetical protein